MSEEQHTIKLTTAQAIIEYLKNQFIEINGQEVRLFGGGFGIFGHGNVTCLGEALYDARKELPLYRGQNEQSMGFAAAGYAKYHLRQRMMFCTASAGPGTANLLTSAALAHANRLPMLMLCGDTFITRLPDPVLQQLEHFGNPTLGVNDAFKSVCRYWDRITHPAQIIQSLPNAIATMLDPADCGPAFLGLPQDVQGWTFDYPSQMFEKKIHRLRRQMPDSNEIDDAVQLLKSAKKPIIIAGGGVQYSGATAELNDFANKHNIPIVETIAGRANLIDSDPYNIGPLGVTGSDSANNIAQDADIIFAVGTRMQDFTTGSWTAFSKTAKIIGLNAARFDAAKHLSTPVVGDAKLGLNAISEKLANYRSNNDWMAFATDERSKWNTYLDENMSTGNRAASYSQVIGATNRLCDKRDRVVAAAGGLPAEVTANWRTHDIGTVDVEFGFSCMGYEIAGAWGARIAQSEQEADNDTIVFVGDGSYLLMNSDIYSSVLTGKKLIILVCDNGGFAVINKLQNNTGNESYNNLIADSYIQSEPFSVDFTAHAKSMGANSELIDNMNEFDAAFARAKASDKTYVIEIKVDPYDGWTTEGHAWWEVGTPHISKSEAIQKAHRDIEAGRKRQRKGV